MGEPSREDASMNAHAKITHEHAVALPPNGAKLLEEYLEKKAQLPALVEHLVRAQECLKESFWSRESEVGCIVFWQKRLTEARISSADLTHV